MGFWDFLRKNKEKEEIKVERISIEELNSWLLNKKRQIGKQEENFLRLIHQRISQLIKELEQELVTLRQINVNERKAEEKIKLIVKENLNNYIDYVEKLAGRLKEIDKEKEIIEKINSIFSDFKKRSAISFEKATFLIGKELASVKESIKNFFKDLENILEENKGWIEDSKIVYLAEKKTEKLAEIQKIKSGTENLIEEYNSKINSLKNEIMVKEEKIQEIKKSEKFSEEMVRRKELENKKQDLEKEINKLKEIVDFKILANFFHIFEKEMNIIKAYKENFKQAFSKTNGEDLLALFREAKIQDVFILNKIQNINEKKKEIDDLVFEDFGIINIEEEIKKINLEIQNWGLKKIEEEKRCKKLETTLTEVTDSIKEELKKINVELG